MLISKMLEAQLLTEKEEDIYRRGRNANSHTKAKKILMSSLTRCQRALRQ